MPSDEVITFTKVGLTLREVALAAGAAAGAVKAAAEANREARTAYFIFSSEGGGK